MKGHRRIEAHAIWEIVRQNAAYLDAICDLELPFSAVFFFGRAIWFCID